MIRLLYAWASARKEQRLPGHCARLVHRVKHRVLRRERAGHAEGLGNEDALVDRLVEGRCRAAEHHAQAGVGRRSYTPGDKAPGALDRGVVTARSARRRYN